MCQLGSLGHVIRIGEPMAMLSEFGTHYIILQEWDDLM